MDQINHQKLHSFSQFKRSQPLIRTLQILVFICMLSLIILWSPSWVTTNIKSWRLILSTSISNLLSLYINRKLMFLVCNAIIVFVTRGFGFVGFAQPAADEINGEDMARDGGRQYRSGYVIQERNGSVEGDGGMVEITESLENFEEDNHHLHHQPRHHLRRHDHGYQHQHHHGHHHSRLHQNQQQQKKQQRQRQQQRRREEQQKQVHQWQEQQQQRKKQLQRQQLLQQQQQQQQEQQLLLLLQWQEQQQQQQQQLLPQQQQEEEDGTLVMEASDEAFDTFIKTMKESMRKENRQLLLTY